MKPLAHAAPLAVAVVLLVAPALHAADKVKVGSKDFTENIILGEIITQLLKRSGIDAELLPSLGDTKAVFEGLEAGKIDVYVEYTGTLIHQLLAGLNVRGD
jgi:osmoprotectant transport system permease protein